MSRLIIQGGRPLRGILRPAGNKNAVLPMLAACLLTDDPVVLRNVPLIEDVRTMLAILEDLGAAVCLQGHRLTLCAAGVRKRVLDPALCGCVRSSLLFAGPMLARYGRVTVSPPGGDVIGRRRLDTHFLALRALGARIAVDRAYTFSARRLRGTDMLLDEASVTATENAMMAAVLADGETTIFNAACEPHVQDLGLLLQAMGARISGLGTNFLRITGVREMHGARHTVCADHIEIASFMAAAAVTGGELEVSGVTPASIAPLRRPLQILGMPLEHQGDRLRLRPMRRRRLCADADGAVPKIEDGPWPAFPSDMMSVAIVLATQVQGTAMFFEKMFESRLYFVDRLIDMGARIVQCDPHRVVVTGPARLNALPVASPDIRAGMAMLVAALAARGETTISNAQVIDRGYENVAARLRRLGADIVARD
ncbi:MAG: UDP-N-acetylglucosamine 1-carboxyvinyltransferase [Kiritimatiellia bacterium]|nr:UDP-N-acetylglucosamine 1-carboxyvinyltransferase [Lentisphaerota bacterium]